MLCDLRYVKPVRGQEIIVASVIVDKLVLQRMRMAYRRHGLRREPGQVDAKILQSEHLRQSPLLPPGDYLDQKIAQMEQQYGDSSSIAQADALRRRYGLDKPMPQRYLHWVSGFKTGVSGWFSCP